MRALIQRVRNASVAVDKKEVSSIEHGLLILLGVGQEDSEDDIQWLANKIVNMRIFGDENGKMNLSVQDIQGDIIVVSQFTLHAQVQKGNRPSFIQAASPEMANQLYERFMVVVEQLINKKVGRGVFGAEMQVALTNDGPVTIWVDTKKRV
jgi:D-tyrosyl-tRNA(Tyr) deacylase